MFQINSNPERYIQRNVRQDKSFSDAASTAAFPTNTVSRAFAAGLYDLGMRTALGIGGAAIARFVTDCPAVGIRVISTRHESGAAFIACELSIAQKEPVAVFCTTGPGFANALLGLISAAWEGSHIVAVVGGSPSHRLGRGAFQETGPEQLALQHWLPPGLTHSVSSVIDQRSLDGALSSITANTSKPEGSLSLVLLPMQAQSEPAAPCRATRLPMRYTHAPCSRDLDKVCETLQGRRLAIWVGAGSVGAEPLIKRFVEQTGAVVAS